MNPKHLLCLLGTVIAGGGNPSFPVEQINLGRENWVEIVKNPLCSSQSQSCQMRIGGYTRSPNNTAYHWEGILRPTQSLPTQFDSVSLWAHIKSNNAGGTRTLGLYTQDLRNDWDSNTRYGDFNEWEMQSSGWENLLASAQISPSDTGWIQFSSPSLQSEMQSWATHPDKAKAGLVLNGNFYYFGSWVDLDQIQFRYKNPDTDLNGVPDPIDSIVHDVRSQNTDSIIPQNKWVTAADGSIQIRYDFSKIADLDTLRSPEIKIPAGVLADTLAPVLIRANQNPNFIVNMDQAAYRLRVNLRSGQSYAQPLPIPSQFRKPNTQFVVQYFSERKQAWLPIAVDSVSQNMVWIRPVNGENSSGAQLNPNTPPASTATTTEYVVSPVEKTIVTIPLGHYQIASEDNPAKIIDVSVRGDFRMGATEISKGLFLDIMSKKYPDHYSNLNASDPTALQAITGVSFGEAVLFCNALTESVATKTGAPLQVAYSYDQIIWKGSKSPKPYLYNLKQVSIANGFRLPFEWEWMIAARNESKKPDLDSYPWGNTTPTTEAWTFANSGGEIQNVDTKLQGLQLVHTADGGYIFTQKFYNLIGNAAEWTGGTYWTQKMNPAAQSTSSSSTSNLSLSNHDNPNITNAGGIGNLTNGVGIYKMGDFETVVIKGGSIEDYTAKNPELFNTKLTRNFREIRNVIYPESIEDKFLEDIKYVGFRVAMGGNSMIEKDEDEDGIPDEQEYKCIIASKTACLYTAKDGSTADISGSSPFRKDIFLQVLYDHSVPTTSAAYPRRASLDSIKNAFARAPTVNIDGSRGIKVHILTRFLDLNLPDNFINSSGHTSQIKYLNSNGNVTIDPSTALSWARLNSKYSLAEEDVYFQIFYASTLHSGTNASGLGNIGSNGLNSVGLNWITGRSEQEVIWGQAQTIMHEIGHNLGLGGDSYNGPSDVSIMNYSQGQGGANGILYTREDGRTVYNTNMPGSDYYIDYGRGGIPDIDGTNLVDHKAVNTSNLLHKKVFLVGGVCAKDKKIHILNLGWSDDPLWSRPVECKFLSHGIEYDWCPNTANLAEIGAVSDVQCDETTTDGLNVIKQQKENLSSINFAGEWSEINIWPQSTVPSERLPLPYSPKPTVLNY